MNYLIIFIRVSPTMGQESLYPHVLRLKSCIANGQLITTIDTDTSILRRDLVA